MLALAPDHATAAGEEEDLDLGKMVREGEVAWLYKRDMPGTGHAEHAEAANPQPWQGHKQSPPSPHQGGSKKRKEPPSGRLSQPTSRPSSAQTAALKQGQHGFQLQPSIELGGPRQLSKMHCCSSHPYGCRCCVWVQF